MSEAELQAAVCSLCRKYNLLYFHSVDSRQDIGPGFPDLVICGLYGLAFIELKAEFGQMTRDQTSWQYRLRSARQRHYVWRPSDLQSGNVERVFQTL